MCVCHSFGPYHAIFSLFLQYLFGDKYLFYILLNQQRARSDFRLMLYMVNYGRVGKVHHAEVKEICSPSALDDKKKEADKEKKNGWISFSFNAGGVYFSIKRRMGGRSPQTFLRFFLFFLGGGR
jgi:hypothetical protein